MNLYTNYECPYCEGKGYLEDGGNVWNCDECDGHGIISSAYIVWSKLRSTTPEIFQQSRLARRLLFQRKILKQPLTYVWWRRATPS